MSYAGSKRAHNLEADIDDNYEGIDGGRVGSNVNMDLSKTLKRIKRLDERNAASEPKMRARPLYQYSAAERQSYYGLVGAIAQVVEDNIIRPKDPEVVNDLRRREAATHSMNSAASVSLLKTRTLNSHYGSSGPLGWLQQPGAVSVSTTSTPSLADSWAREAGAGLKHVHSKEDVLITDVRYRYGKVLADLTLAEKRQMLFPYFTMSPIEKGILQRMSQHNTFVRFADEFEREQTVATLESVVKRSEGMSLFAVRFAYDCQVQVVFNLDLDAVYYGVLVFSLILNTLQPTRKLSIEGAAALRERVKTDVSKERDEAAKKAREPAATITALVKDIDVLAELAKMRELSDAFFKAYDEVAASVSGTKVDRLIARSCPLAVFYPRKSAALLGAAVKFEYYHFASCQDVIDDSDLHLYKQCYAKAAKTAPALPTYDSDNESETR
jgi:hypothetical protein